MAVIFVAIVASVPVMGYLHGTDHLPYRDHPQGLGQPRSAGSGRKPNGEPTSADVRPHQAATSDSCCS